MSTTQGIINEDNPMNLADMQEQIETIGKGTEPNKGQF